ncbi:unnamed protein product, partial [Thlaspi arvense]
MEHETIDFEQGWDDMQPSITKLKRFVEGLPESSFDASDYMMLYTSVYRMCIQKPPCNYSRQLYNKYGEVIEDYINSTALPALRENHDDEYMLLQELVKRWSNHKKMVKSLSKIFHYLEYSFIPFSSFAPLKEVSLACFRDLVYNKLQLKVKEAVVSLVDREREGVDIDRVLMKNVLEFYVEIGMGEMKIYEQDFESFFLEDTTSYYSSKASRWIQEDSFSDYTLKAEECIKKEKESVTNYLHSSSVPKLVKVVEHALLVVRGSQLLEKKHSEFSEIVQKLVTDADGEDTATKVQVLLRNIIEMHDKYMVYVTGSFQNQNLIYNTFKKAFESFCIKITSGSYSRDELLATFCDGIILKNWGSGELSDEGVEKVVKFLACISDEWDIFSELYRKKLARRLLSNRGANDDHERSILTKLKQQFGGSFTFKMEGMLKDMILSRENQNSFNEYAANNAKPGIGLTPNYKTFDINLPSEMVKCVEEFKDFYEMKTRSRKLTWIHSLRTCHINGKFDQKPIELIVSTHQAVLLLLFNTRDKLSYTDIQSQLNLSHEDLVWLLHSLSCAKYKILIKKPSTKTVSKTDVFEFNSGFTVGMRRIKIPLPPVDERKKASEDVDKDRRYETDAAIVRIMKGRRIPLPPVDERKKASEDVDKDRRYETDAAIVRIMKGMRVLGYQQLVSECVQKLSLMFKPDIKEIKKRIKDLIARDYLERDKENPTMF